MSELVPYIHNAKKHPQLQVDQIAASISEFGNCDPIAVWHNTDGEAEIVEGHGRLLALKKLGIKEAPVIFLDHLTDEQRRAYTHVHNQTTLSSDFDWDVLVQDMEELEFRWDDFGFTDAAAGTASWFERSDRDMKAKQEGNDEYNEFVEKFEPKKTTDDCYTPDVVYDAVADWVAAEYGVDRAKFVRPFYPGGDFERYDYPEGGVVVDNPPFSILSRIARFYCSKGIRFFIFAPTLTLFGSSRDCDVCYVATKCIITYENGAKVNTSFITNLETDAIVRTAPALDAAVEEADRQNREEQSTAINLKYKYPPYVLTSAMASGWGSYGVEFRLKKGQVARISALDAQLEYDKAIYGCGFLLSEQAKAAAEQAKAAAEQAKAAAEQAKALEAAKALGDDVEVEQDGSVVWRLSDREWAIVESLSHAS